MKLHTLLAAATSVVLVSSLAHAATYLGNGGTGFGGPIGTSTLSVSETTPGTIDFSLTAGVPFSGNALILYFDTKTGGVADTSTLTDTSDPGRTAISGANAGNPSRTLAVFPAGFTADYAATVEPGVFGGLFDINNTPSNFGFVASGNLSGSGSGPYTFSYTRAQLGLGATDPLNFVGTLISTSAYRSNETIGASVTVPGSVGDTPNAGFNGTTTFTLANTFAVPEPATLSALAGLGALALRRRK